MTPDEIRAIPSVNMQMKMQLEICAQTAELRDAILLVAKQNELLIKELIRSKKEIKSSPEAETEVPRKTERPALK